MKQKPNFQMNLFLCSLKHCTFKYNLMKATNCTHFNLCRPDITSISLWDRSRTMRDQKSDRSLIALISLEDKLANIKLKGALKFNASVNILLDASKYIRKGISLSASNVVTRFFDISRYCI